MSLLTSRAVGRKATFTQSRILATVVCLALLAAGIDPAQANPSKQLVTPIEGSLLLAGQGAISKATFEAFLYLSGGPGGDVVVLQEKDRSLAGRWKKSGVRAQAFGPKSMASEKFTKALLEAEGVWIENGVQALERPPLLAELLRSVLARGGAVLAHGKSCQLLSASDGGFGLLPKSRLRLLDTVDHSGALQGLDELLEPGDGLVGWQISKSSTLVIHHGRRVAALGKGSIVAQVAGANGWAGRRAVIPPAPNFQYGDLFAYEIDLLAWVRSARDRLGPVFPPKKAAKAKLPKGTLVLSGGGGVQSPTWSKFIDAAGGKEARIVCIPSGAKVGPGEVPSSYSARQLREHGCTNVTVFHVAGPQRAESDFRLHALLEQATGVWIDGGRTYRIIDSYQHTKVHALLQRILDRGGVVGGSSAGCQVAGDFLLRGDPRTNRRLVFDGYTTGLGFLRGVVLDAHFLQRDRHGAFVDLMKRYPQMLGIGVDEDTALIVRGSIAEVLGQESVSFYDFSGKRQEPVILKQGGRYDISKRRPLR